MKFVYIGKGMEVTDSLKARVEKKLAKLERYFQDDVEAQVRLSQERGNRNIVEITISVGSVILRAEEVSNDMYMSIDRAVDKLNRQIRRHRTKLEKRLRAGAFEPVAEEQPEAEEEEVASYNLVRVKKFPVKPMHVDDAIAQMELLGHTFFLFLNEETDSMCVLYLRSDGSYGLLQPE
ncbi:MAG TPA: ribosome-associated translation inhibitor RaiA [Candidatus Pullichristensenella avicola]|nr:ribosome-associated translation inhibitor RaiA [Candidatus Pullichristensenella avicola]